MLVVNLIEFITAINLLLYSVPYMRHLFFLQYCRILTHLLGIVSVSFEGLFAKETRLF